MQPWPLSQGLCGWYVLQCLQGQVTLREPEGRGRPFPGAEAAGSPVSRPLPQGRGGHLFHVVPAGDSGPGDGTLHVESPPSVLSLVSDEPVFLLRPHQRLLKNTGPVGSVPGTTALHSAPALGAREPRWGPRRAARGQLRATVLPRVLAAGTPISPTRQTRTARTTTEKAGEGGTRVGRAPAPTSAVDAGGEGPAM